MQQLERNANPCPMLQFEGLKPTVGVWLSLVERLVRDQEVGCSNHLTPTMKKVLFV